MRLVLIADTHGRHPELPDGDVLVHAGDLTAGGSLAELKTEIDWLKSQPHEHKIFIGGNHDWACQHFMTEGREDLLRDMAAPMHYLRDSSVTIRGVEFYGSPWQPWFCDWAFNLRRGTALKEKWDLIPTTTDVLITHGPPYGILDRVGGDHVGCEELRTAVDKLKPAIHVFGHIHCAYGTINYGETTFYNAALCNEAYQLTDRQKPWIVDVAPDIP